MLLNGALAYLIENLSSEVNLKFIDGLPILLTAVTTSQADGMEYTMEIDIEDVHARIVARRGGRGYGRKTREFAVDSLDDVVSIWQYLTMTIDDFARANGQVLKRTPDSPSRVTRVNGVPVRNEFQARDVILETITDSALFNAVIASCATEFD